jgi:hypothetical protein
MFVVEYSIYMLTLASISYQLLTKGPLESGTFQRSSVYFVWDPLRMLKHRDVNLEATHMYFT